MTVSIIYTVCSNKKEAEHIGKFLVEKKFAACANWWDINSCYSWKGKIEEGTETILLVKTVKDKIPSIFSKIKELHSYETPALFTLPVGFVDDDYLEWVNHETKENL